MNPKVTVLMPVYNGGKYLKEAIDSILNQTFIDFEFLIINDGSTDNSTEIVKSYDDKRINFVENEFNMGLASTLNKGLDIAKGEYIVRMDQDDISLPKRIEKQVEFMDKNPKIGICGSWAKFFGEMNFVAKYSRTNREIITNSFYSCPMAHPTVIFRRESFNKYNLKYNPDFKTAEDYELWTRASRHIKFANIQKVLLNYRTGPFQMTKSQNILGDANKIIWKMQLENLGINFSDEELRMHQLVISEKYTITDSELFLKKSIAWFDKILYKIKDNENYDNKILLKTFKHKWYIAFKPIIGIEKDFNIFRILGFSKQFKYLTIEHKFRLLYRHFRKKIKDKR